MDSANNSTTINNKLSDSNLSQSKSNMNYEEATCKICNSIMIFPVTLPCGHELCLDCYEKSVEFANLLCPYCRLRISCWARKATKDNKIVNWKKWDLIQTNFPDLVKMKVESNSSNDENSEDLQYDLIYYCEPVSRVISSAGEIRKEFEELSQKEKEKQLAEEEATKLLIEKLLEEQQQIIAENKQKLAEETINDEEIARSLQQQSYANIKTLRNGKILIN